MKIIQVNVVYGKGSTGRLTLQLHQYFLAQGHDSLVLYGRGQSSTDPKVIKVGSEFSSKVKNLESEWFCKDPLKGSRHSTNQILSYIKAFKPDVILLQCLNGFFLDYYSLLSQISTLKIKTFLVLHAFFPFTGYCGYPFACQQWQKGCSHCQENDPAFRLFFPKRVEKWFLQKQRIYNSFPNLRFIAVSPYLLAKAEDSPLIGSHSIECIQNGIDTTIFHHRDKDDARKALGLSLSQKIVLFVSPNLGGNNKSLSVFQSALMALDKEVDLGIAIGPGSSEKSSTDKLKIIGEVKDPCLLALYYCSADALVMLSKSETFGIPAAEALCCGTPVFGFKNGGTESFAEEYSPFFCNYGDFKMLPTLCARACQINRQILAEKAKPLSLVVMEEKYLSLFRN